MSVRDPLLLLVAMFALIWGWSCFGADSDPSSCTLVQGRANDKAGVSIDAQGGSATLQLTPRSVYVEYGCSFRRTILNKGRTSSATVTPEGSLMVTGSLQEAGTHLTTVTVQSRTENCSDPRFNNSTTTDRIAVNFD